jgi:S1-C subfamily serine protease
MNCQTAHGSQHGGMVSLILACAMSALLVSGCASSSVTRKSKPSADPRLNSPDVRFAGVGLILRTNEAGLTVVSPIQNTPAFRAGLLPGDIVAGINGEDTRTMTLPAAVDKMRGRAGTVVKLKVVRPSTQETREYTLTREVSTHWVVPPTEQSPAATPPATLLPPAQQPVPF